MSFNSITVGDMYQTMVTCDGAHHAIEFYIATRHGSTIVMIQETVRHFIKAIRLIAEGEINGGDEFAHRSDYGDRRDESYVSIWVQKPGIPVLLEKGTRMIQVNVFTEATSANDFAHAVYLHVNGMAKILDTDIVQMAGQPNQLDKFFPRDENNKPVAPVAPKTNNLTPALPSASISGSSSSEYLGAYDYKKKSEYMKLYTGKTVKFDVMKMERVFNKKHGAPEVQVYGIYNGGASKWPALSLTIKQNALENVDEYTAAILLNVLESGAIDTGHYIGTYFMYVPQDKPDKLYPILVKLEAKA